MPPFRIICVRCLLIVTVAYCLMSTGLAMDPVTIRVSNEAAGPVDRRIFGQFLERASWGEPGPESIYVPEAPYIRADALQKLREMKIPVIRFPGGTDIDYIDWRDMIDNAHGREAPGRPVTRGYRGHDITNRFGYDEYFALRDELGCETIIVLNLMDALAKRKPLREAALESVGLLAYINAPVGAKLPDDMPDWPSIRAKNGHPEPFRAEYIQIGNEIWVPEKKTELDKALEGMDDTARANWITECFREFVRLIREIDPTVRLIIDHKCPYAAQEIYLRDSLIRKEVEFVTFHSYGPWTVNRAKVLKEERPTEKLDTDDWWAVWNSTPGSYEPGTVQSLGHGLTTWTDLGYSVACTEWNWNGWLKGDKPFQPGANWRAAAGLGAAGWLHGMMRNGNQCTLATQSMLVGGEWDIASVVTSATGNAGAFFSPTGAVTALYSNHHGSELLNISVDPTPRLEVTTDGFAPILTASLIDAVATRGEGRVFVHLINRSMRDSIPVKMEIDGLQGRKGTLHTLMMLPFNDLQGHQRMPVTEKRSTDVFLEELCELPPASVSVLEIATSP